VDKKRALLLKVEAEIKKLMGEQEKGSLDLRHIGAVQIEKIQDLIGTRSLILNQMFQATSQEIKRFEAVNELLNSLTKKMYHRMANLYRTLINSPKDESFDDDYIIRGTLRYVFCGVESILELPEDSYYGSDFAYMIELICCCFWISKGCVEFLRGRPTGRFGTTENSVCVVVSAEANYYSLVAIWRLINVINHSEIPLQLFSPRLVIF
jgi:hypothetical protein